MFARVLLVDLHTYTYLFTWARALVDPWGPMASQHAVDMCEAVEVSSQAVVTNGSDGCVLLPPVAVLASTHETLNRQP